MRSFVFIFISLLVHSLAVVALAIPRLPALSALSGESLQLSLQPSTQKNESQTAPPASAPTIKKPKASVTALLKRSKESVATTTLPPKDTSVPEQLNPNIDDQDISVVVKNISATESTPSELIPSRETVGDGSIEAMNDPTGDSSTEATADEGNVEDPSPIEVSDGSQNLQEKEVNDDLQPSAPKAGSTKEGAISYLGLKQITGNRPPDYPVAARREHRQGDLELTYRVTSEGLVADISVSKSSGHDDLDEAALNAISRFKFVPGQEGWARHPVTFSLKGPDEELPSQIQSEQRVKAQ